MVDFHRKNHGIAMDDKGIMGEELSRIILEASPLGV